MIQILHNQRAAKKKQSENKGGPAEWGTPRSVSHCNMERRSSITAGGTIWTPPALASKSTATRPRPSSLSDKHKTKGNEKRKPRVTKKERLEDYDKNNQHAYIAVTNEDIILRSTLNEHKAMNKKCTDIVKQFDGVKDLIAQRVAEKCAATTSNIVVNIDDHSNDIENESESCCGVDCGDHVETVNVYNEADIDAYACETSECELNCQMECVGIDS
ncbi:uncharacterized protein [Clytia hemisphaerica]|uniref:Uncharacterized protein n=1 Tax=Clytia hemisphaerica TaxID=252671 RepID=A0A7M6DP90_9CNID